MKKKKMRIMAIGAHPDDIELLCAGTLAKYKDRGDEIIICNVLNGNKGHVVIPSDKLAKIRIKEARKSASLIGAKHITLGDPDCEFYLNQDTVERVMDLLREVQPDIIFTHYPNDYMPDHVIVSQVVFHASFHASLPLYKTRNKPIKSIPPLYYMDTLAGLNFQPEEYVDITDYIKLKQKMLATHSSQYVWLKKHDNIDVVEYMTAMSRFRGLQCGVKYAEGFIQLKVWGRVHPKRFLP